MTAGQYSYPARTSRSLLAHTLGARAAVLAESAATVFVVFVVSGALFPLLRGGTGEVRPLTPVDHLVNWSTYAFILICAARHPRALRRAATCNPFLPAVALIAIVSAAWSIDPATTLREAGFLCMGTVFGLYLAGRYSTEELLRHLGLALAIIAVMSVVFGIAIPKYGISPEVLGGAWRGVFIQKNLLGQAMVLACIVFALLGRTRCWPTAAACGFGALAFVLVILSHSKMAIVTLLALAALVPAVIAFRRGGRSAIAAVCIGLAGITVAAFAFVARDWVLHALGKNPTLTGRTELWAAVSEQISKRPLLGYGYAAFWQPGTPLSDALRAMLGWNVPHSHDVFLDMWLDLGLPGVVALAAGFLVGVARAWSALRIRSDVIGVWAISVLIMNIPFNLIASLVYENRLGWVMLVSVSACGAYRLFPERRRET